MAKPSDHPGFKSLLNQWNQKLKESGFKDIEEMRSGELHLKKTGSDYRFALTQADPIAREAKAKYYEIIGERLIETVFDDEQERQILCLYHVGTPQAEIKRKLKIEGHRCKVYRPIYKWLKRWGLK